MKLNKSKALSVKCNSFIDKSIRNQQTIQRQAAKKYLKFKKSASQPVYFLNQSRLKRISDIYRISSIQKLSKSSKNIKSLYNSLTPQKKSSFNQNVSTKKNNLFNTVNINKLFDTNQKTKRLVLTKPNQKKEKHDYQFQLKQTINNFEKLQQISKLNMQKSFIGQYFDYFRSISTKLKQNIINSQNFGIKSVILNFINLIQACQARVRKYQEKQDKLKYSSIQNRISSLNIDLKKKQIKIQLLNKQIQELKLKTHYSQYDKPNKSSMNLRQHFKIQRVLEFNLSDKQQRLQQNKKERKSMIIDNEIDILRQAYQNLTIESKNKAVQLITKIRQLQKKQKQLVTVLIFLRNDGVNIQKAYEDVMNFNSEQDKNSYNQFQLQLFTKLNKIPRQIKHIKNNNSYDGDISIIQSCDGLSINNIGQFSIDQDYPIKHQYISKALNSELQQKLKLDFNCLYQEESFDQNSQSSSIHNVQ